MGLNLLGCKYTIFKCTEQNILRATVIVWLRYPCHYMRHSCHYMLFFHILSKPKFAHIHHSTRQEIIQTLYVTPTRITKQLSGRGNQWGIWNVLLLGLHLAIHSVNEKLDCFTGANTGSNGNPELQKFSFNELGTLIMFP